MVKGGVTVKDRINTAVVELLKRCGDDLEPDEIFLSQPDMLQLYLENENFRLHYKGFTSFVEDAGKHGVAWWTVAGNCTVRPTNEDTVKIRVTFKRVKKPDGKVKRAGFGPQGPRIDDLSETLAGPCDRIH